MAQQQIYTVLKQEHKECARLLKEMTKGQPTQQQIDQLYTSLEAHTRAEEKTLYKDLKASDEAREQVLEAIEEHHVVDVLLKEIKRLKPDDEKCQAKLMVLKENVMHHVQEEEEKLFPQAKELMNQQWAVLMTERFKEQEQVLQQQYH